jgi:hypothetical protein
MHHYVFLLRGDNFLRCCLLLDKQITKLLSALLFQVENIYQQENKKMPLKGTGEPEQNDSALQDRCANLSQGLAYADGPPVDALKNRISSLLFTASQSLENQHRAM